MHSSDHVSSRTRRFVSETLGADPEAVQSMLSSRRVAITVTEGVAGTFTAQAITFCLLNLLVRLDLYCPHLHVSLPDVERHALLRLLEPGSLRASLKAFFRPFSAASRLQVGASRDYMAGGAGLHVVVGPEPAPGTLSVWADGWMAYLNERPRRLEGSPNTVGANVAAALAAAEIFKKLVAGLPVRPGLRILPVERLVFSAYDYGLKEGANPDLPSGVDLDGVVLVGAGGIGSATVAAAASLESIRGRLALVDDDTLDDTNLNRHLVSRPGDRGAKVDLCRRALGFHADVDPRAERFERFVAREGDRHDLVVVTVDHDGVRRKVQESLPRILLNAGTGDDGSFRVSRHDFVSGACLSCISRADLRENPAERGLAEVLGLDLSTLLQYHDSGEGIPASVLRKGGALTEAEVLELAGRPLAEARAKVCADLRLIASPDAGAVSISFLSALPGFLLLGEILKERLYAGSERPPLNTSANHALMSILGKPNEHLLRGCFGKREECDCTRGAYARTYARKWRQG